MYDIFFIIQDKQELKDKIREQFPLAKFCIFDENTEMLEVLISAQKRSLTKMFWLVDTGYQIEENFGFNYTVPQWDEKYVHIFKEKKTQTYGGVYLIPKTYQITKNEAEHIFFINRKEIPIVASKINDYEVFFVKTYNDYLEARKNSNSEMFYIVYSDLNLLENFTFDYNVEMSTKHLNHIFKNGNFYDGLFITSKKQKITEKEFNNRFIINRTEIDILASEFQNFEVITCNSYNEYSEKIKLIKTPMAYVITSDIQINDFKFDYQVPKWNQDKVHVFKNGNYFDGVCIFPKDKIVTQKEFDYKFFINKIEVDIEASTPKSFDIVFISYSELNADNNYQDLIKRFPRAKRIHGIKGIHQAHIEAAKIVETPMFWVVDGDAQILKTFEFNYQIPVWNHDTVHVWRSQNPINGLQYGYGGVKLLPTNLTRNLDITSVDMTTSISSKFKAIPETSNISKFNTNEFDTWKSAFRECVKLSSRIISGQNDKESLYRLDVWCTEGKDEEYGNFAIEGAKLGKDFGFKYKNNPAMLSKINDWNWLEKEFQKYRESIC